MLEDKDADFLCKMADLAEKEMKILNAGDRVADWFDKRIATSGFVFGWFWTILGVSFMFLVFMPLFYVLNAVFNVLEWRVERKYKRLCKKSG